MDKKYEVTAELKVTITAQNIDDIMAGALEGGIHYWVGEAEVVEEKRVAEWGHEQIARGGVLILHDIEDPDQTWELTPEKFLNGFKLWVESGGDRYGAVQGEAGGAIVVDCCEIDAGCADEIIQYALFNEIVFA